MVQSEQPLTEGRLLRLIVALAQRARLSSRGELYPVGMAPSQSLRLVSGLLAGRELTLAQLQELVLTRYPEAAALPTEELAIDALFGELNLMMRWDDGKHRFRSSLATSHSGRSRISTTSLRPPGPCSGARPVGSNERR